MTKRKPWWIVPVAVVGAIWWTSRGTASAADPPPDRRVTGDWVDSDAPRRIRAIARPIEQAANWPGLGDYLAGIAYTESRGNAQAGKDSGNAARGWFGIRPVSGRVGDLGLSGDALKNERYAVALAAWYAHRLRPYASSGQSIDWLAIRRGWAYPHLVDNVDHPGFLSQLQRGLSNAGSDPSLAHRRAFPPGYQWPGIDTVLALVGAR